MFLISHEVKLQHPYTGSGEKLSWPVSQPRTYVNTTGVSNVAKQIHYNSTYTWMDD